VHRDADEGGDPAYCEGPVAQANQARKRPPTPVAAAIAFVQGHLAAGGVQAECLGLGDAAESVRQAANHLERGGEREWKNASENMGDYSVVNIDHTRVDWPHSKQVIDGGWKEILLFDLSYEQGKKGICRCI